MENSNFSFKLERDVNFEGLRMLSNRTPGQRTSPRQGQDTLRPSDRRHTQTERSKTHSDRAIRARQTQIHQMCPAWYCHMERLHGGGGENDAEMEGCKADEIRTTSLSDRRSLIWRIRSENR
eukprot:1378079-Rhodomonas_salina.1